MPEHSQDFRRKEINELRGLWQQLWGKHPHRLIRRPMLEKGITFKQAENSGAVLDIQQQARRDKLVRQYKRDPASFNEKQNAISTGSVLVRVWRGRKYVVTVHDETFEYAGTRYGSLSQIATLITGTRWNGRVFFGLKQKPKGAQ